MVAGSILDLIGNTPLVEIPHFSPQPGVRLYAKLEGHNPTGSVKDRVAYAMVRRAEREGLLRPGQTILEPTSGNTGIGLALVGRLRGYPVTVVMPENVSEERVQLLRAYGARIVFSPGGRGTNGAIEVAEELAGDSEYYLPFQYGNPANIQAHYDGTGAEIAHDLPGVTAFVAGLGTGGTLMGVGRRLRELNPEVKIVAAEPQQGEAVSGLRSLADGFVPPILDLDVLDSRMLVDSEAAFATTRELLEHEGIFAGCRAAPSSTWRAAGPAGWTRGAWWRCCRTVAGSTSVPGCGPARMTRSSPASEGSYGGKTLRSTVSRSAWIPD